MSIQTPNMNLTEWDQLGNHYSHTQLATNFALIDSHDHTPGKGKLIPPSGLDLAALETEIVAPLAEALLPDLEDAVNVDLGIGYPHAP